MNQSDCDSIGEAKRYLVVAGPTASGKSSLAHQLALDLNGEIVNCDSVQLYRGLDIGAAKASRKERAEVVYHLLDCLDWHQAYDARQFADAARQAIEQIIARNRLPIVVGGTGLYLRALWNESWHDLPADARLRSQLAELSNEQLYEELKKIDEARASQIHQNDRYRLIRAVEVCRLVGASAFEKRAKPSRRNEAFAIKMERERGHLHQRIEVRSLEMLDSGLINEVKNLIEQGWDVSSKPLKSIGYKQVLDVLAGRLDESDLYQAIVIATRQYAKRQETWFRKLDFDFYWRQAEDYERLLALLQNRFFHQT